MTLVIGLPFIDTTGQPCLSLNTLFPIFIFFSPPYLGVICYSPT
jgi:hypothetical protein